MEKFIFAFLVGGGICVIGQILMDVFKLTPAHTLCTLVVAGAVLGGFGLYDPLIKFAGAGARYLSAVSEIHCLKAPFLKRNGMGSSA